MGGVSDQMSEKKKSRLTRTSSEKISRKVTKQQAASTTPDVEERAANTTNKEAFEEKRKKRRSVRQSLFIFSNTFSKSPSSDQTSTSSEKKKPTRRKSKHPPTEPEFKNASLIQQAYNITAFAKQLGNIDMNSPLEPEMIGGITHNLYLLHSTLDEVKEFTVNLMKMVIECEEENPGCCMEDTLETFRTIVFPPPPPPGAPLAPPPPGAPPPPAMQQRSGIKSIIAQSKSKREEQKQVDPKQVEKAGFDSKIVDQIKGGVRLRTVEQTEKEKPEKKESDNPLAGLKLRTVSPEELAKKEQSKEEPTLKFQLRKAKAMDDSTLEKERDDNEDDEPGFGIALRPTRAPSMSKKDKSKRNTIGPTTLRKTGISLANDTDLLKKQIPTDPNEKSPWAAKVTDNILEITTNESNESEDQTTSEKKEEQPLPSATDDKQPPVDPENQSSDSQEPKPEQMKNPEPTESDTSVDPELDQDSDQSPEPIEQESSPPENEISEQKNDCEEKSSDQPPKQESPPTSEKQTQEDDEPIETETQQSLDDSVPEESSPAETTSPQDGSKDNSDTEPSEEVPRVKLVIPVLDDMIPSSDFSISVAEEEIYSDKPEKSDEATSKDTIIQQ